MTQVKILLSEANTLGDFPKAVADYIAALELHRTQEGTPAPTAHPLVENAVRRVQYLVEAVHQPTRTYVGPDGEDVTEPVGEPVRFMSSTQPDDFVPNYVLVDDTPPPPSLDERKAELARCMAVSVGAMIDRISPPLRRRLFNMTVARVYRVPEESRTAADKAVLAQADDSNARVEAVEFHLAQMEAQIHDLTADTIDAWKPAPFPG